MKTFILAVQRSQPVRWERGRPSVPSTRRGNPKVEPVFIPLKKKKKQNPN